MAIPISDESVALSKSALEAFDRLSGGVHPGFRPTHAKGILLSGLFTPAEAARSLTRAPHLQRPFTPVTVRFSDFGGIPAIPDGDPNSSPRGMATRFHLAEHTHTDIVAHSINGFPARTAEEFVEFLRAIAASGPDTPHPKPVEAFLGTHPAALRFVQTPAPIPVSFAVESFFAVSAYKFTNADGLSRFGRYRIHPEAGAQYLDAAAAAAQPANFLQDELKQRLTAGPFRMRITVQLAEPGDVVDDSTLGWPDTRSILDFGTVELRSVVPDNEAEQRRIIFDPIPRVDGIETSGDPLLDPRADLYLMSGHRRRTGAAAGEVPIAVPAVAR